MRIVVRSSKEGLWWWAALTEQGEGAAVSAPYKSRTDCLQAIAELKVEGPVAPVTFDQSYAASPGTWTISSLIPSGS